MASNRVVYNGYVVYCYYHDQGAIIKLDCSHDEECDDALSHGRKKIIEISDNLGKRICSCNGCNFKFHGLSLEDKIIIGETQKMYDILGGGWKTEYFKEEMYKMSSFDRK